MATTGRTPHDPADAASGVAGAALSLAQCQARAGHTVDLWGWNDARPAGQTVTAGISLWTSPTWPWARFGHWDFRWLAPLWWHVLSAPRADILHVHVDPSLLYLPRAGLRLLHLHTPIPEPFPPTYARALRCAAAVICCSDFIRAQFLNASRWPPDRAFTVHNGAELDAYERARADNTETQRAIADLRHEWGLPPGALVILYAGAIVPPKGVIHLVHALAHIQEASPHAILAVAGSARLWPTPDGNSAGEKYESRVRESARGRRIRFLGDVPRARMPGLYLAADLVCVPSIWEDPHPTVVCEAMAAGRPVVASRVGGIPETVRHGETGFLVPPGDEEALTRAVEVLASDATLRARMGQAARRRARQFTWQASARRLDRIYRGLLDGC